MNRIAPLTLATLLLVGATGVVAAQNPTDTIKKVTPTPMAAPAYKRTVPDSLVKLVKISEDSARGLALSKVQSGTLQAVLLQRFRGKLVWSFVIRDPAKAANTEVYIDAVNGSFVDPTQKASS